MRQLIIDRIHAVFKWDPPSPDRFRYESGWFDTTTWERTKFFPTKKERKNNPNIIHISKIDFNQVPDDKLIDMFEYILYRAYRQM